MGKQEKKQEYNALLLLALIHNAYDASSALAVQWNHINKYRHITSTRGQWDWKKKKKKKTKRRKKD